MCRSEQAYVLLNERSNQRAQCICHLIRLRMRLLRERDSAHCSHCSLRGCCCQIRPPPRLEEQLLLLLRLSCRFQFVPFPLSYGTGNIFMAACLAACLPAIERHRTFLSSSAIPCLCYAGFCAAAQRAYNFAQLRTCTHVCAPWHWLSNQPVDYNLRV